MAPSTPDTPESAPAKKPAARKTPARKPAAKTAAAKAQKADEEVAPTAEQPVAEQPVGEQPAVQPEEVPQTVTEDAATAAREQSRDSQREGSILDGVRANPMGPVTVGLGIAIGIGLLLSVLVPAEPNVLAMSILGVLLAAAIGFSMRYLSGQHNVVRQIEAFVVTVIGIHVMAVTGSLNIDLPFLSQFGVSGPGFNETVLAALATPPVSTGGLIAGVVAAIIVGWGSGRNRS